MPTLVNKTYVLGSSYDTIRFQLTLYVFLKDFPLSKGEVNALSVFYLKGINEDAVEEIITEKIFKNRQTVTNFITKLVKIGVVKKTTKKKKEFTDMIPITVDKSILLNVKIGNK